MNLGWFCYRIRLHIFKSFMGLYPDPAKWYGSGWIRLRIGIRNPAYFTDRYHHTHCSQPFFIVSPDWIPPGAYSWQPKTLPACQASFFSSSFTWLNPISAAFCLWVGRSYPFAARVGDSHPSVLLHLSGRAPTCQSDKFGTAAYLWCGDLNWTRLYQARIPIQLLAMDKSPHPFLLLILIL